MKSTRSSGASVLPAPAACCRLVLFDIDQTLIYTAGAGMRSLGRAILDVTGLSIQKGTGFPDGKTDPLILRELLADLPVDVDIVAPEIWRVYEGYLGEELARADERRTLKPGVPAVLHALTHDPRFKLGLLSGNLEATARIKLAAFDLNRYFPLGAFGSDATDRCALGPIALARARAHFGIDFKAGQAWVVGDTLRDIQAAHACGARALAVATGNSDESTLRNGGADAVLPDLAETKRVLAILGS